VITTESLSDLDKTKIQTKTDRTESSSFAVLPNKTTNIITLLNKTNSDMHLTPCSVINGITLYLKLSFFYNYK